MGRVVNVEIQCTSCGNSATFCGNDIDVISTVKRLERIGWFSGHNVVLCPECHIKAQRHLLFDVMNGDTNDTELQ